MSRALSPGVSALPATPRQPISASIRLGDVLLGITTVWVLLYNNSHIADLFGSDDRFILVSIPRETRLLEAFTIATGTVLLSVRIGRAGAQWIAAASLAFVLIAAGGIAREPGYLPAQFQGAYLYVSPLLVFLWCTTIPVTARVVRHAVNLLAIWLAVSVAVMLLFQLPPNEFVKGDWAHGLFSDAHVFGAWLAVASCVTFSMYASSREARWLIVSIVALLCSYYPANEKMILFNLGWIAVSAVRWTRRQSARRAAAFLATMALAVTVGVVAMTSVVARDDEDPFMIRTLSARALSELGPVAAWSAAWREIAVSPVPLLVGLGSANYAGVAAGRTLLANDDVATAATRRMREMIVTGEGIAGGFAIATNTWANLFAEFGACGLIVIILALARVAHAVGQWRPERGFEEPIQLLFFALLAAVVFQGLVTPFTNWGEPVLTYPMMLFGGYGWQRRRMDRSAASARL